MVNLLCFRSTVIDKLIDERHNSKHGIGYFYCEYSQASEAQAPDVIITSFIRQLSLQLKSIPVEISELREKHTAKGTRPDLQELISLLLTLSSRFSRIWLLVDAVDEYDPKDLDALMEAFENLVGHMSILITSRPQTVNSTVLIENAVRCVISAQAWDMEVVIRSRLATAAIAPRGLRGTLQWESFVDETISKLVGKSDGMFILVSFQLDMLLKPRTLFEMRRVLDNVPEKLGDFYSLTIERIQARESDLALKALAWVVKSLRPLQIHELREALAVEYSVACLNSEALVHEEDLVEMCCGLVRLDDEGLVHAAHSTAHEYLAYQLEIVRSFDSTIATTCLRYLALDNSTTRTEDSFKSRSTVIKCPDCDNYFHQYDEFFKHPGSPFGIRCQSAIIAESEWAKNTKRSHFLAYAGKNWPQHTRMANDPADVVELAAKLLKSDKKEVILHAFSENKEVKFGPEFTPLHAAAVFGSVPLFQLLLQDAIQEGTKQCRPIFAIVDSKDMVGNTPLLFAILHRHREIAKILLETWAVNPRIQDDILFRWMIRWGQEGHEILKLMLQIVPDAKADFEKMRRPGLLDDLLEKRRDLKGNFRLKAFSP